MALVLDEPKETDDVFKVNGFTMLIDKDLHETIKNVTVDFSDHGMSSGFRVISEVPVGSGVCGGSCSC